MTLRITGIILIILGLLDIFFFWNYSGEVIPLPMVWLIGGVVMVSLAVFLLFRSFTDAAASLDEVVRDQVDQLKQEGEKIEVNLDECEIMTNNYTRELERKSKRAHAIDAVYDSSQNIITETVNQAVLVYKRGINGEEETFYSPTIYKDETSLRWLLERQKKTAIYVDKDDRSLYYFDVAFLKDPS